MMPADRRIVDHDVVVRQPANRHFALGEGVFLDDCALKLELKFYHRLTIPLTFSNRADSLTNPGSPPCRCEPRPLRYCPVLPRRLPYLSRAAPPLEDPTFPLLPSGPV